MKHRPRRPRWLYEGIEPDGNFQFACPPDPATGGYIPVGLRDWLSRPDIWEYRNISRITGCGVDTTHWIRDHFKSNIGCETSRQCHGCPDYCGGETDGQKMAQMAANPDTLKCQKWVKFGHNWRDLWGKERGKTALVLGPGPHLLDHADEIRELAKDRDKYFTIGFSRLLFADLPLHYYTTLERRLPAKVDPHKMKFPDTILISSTTAHPGFKLMFKERNRYYGEAFGGVTKEGRFLDSGMERMTIAMGNITPDTLIMAYKLGARKMKLYGIECACTVGEGINPDTGKRQHNLVDKYYFDMTMQDQHLKFYGLAQQKYFPMIGVDGEPYACDYSLVSTSMYIEATCQLLADRYGVDIENRTMKGNFWWGYDDPEVQDLKARVKELEAQLAAKTESVSAAITQDIPAVEVK